MNIKRLFTLVLLALVLVQGYRIIRDAGVYRELTYLPAKQCETLTGPVGAEDITIDRLNRLAYIGADDRRGYLVHGDQQEASNGGIWVLDLSNASSQAELITPDFEGPFHPHGIDLYQHEGMQELYVVNHLSATEHEIVIFTIPKPGVLKLKRRITYPELISPNDISVYAEDQFLVTNDHGSPRHSLMEKLEDYLGLARASVSYFDGEQGHLVIRDLRYPNGITLSEDRGLLYLSETTGRQLLRYKRGDSALDWELQHALPIDSGLDNLEWDEHGRLLTAAHPKIFSFMAHMYDAEHLSPSEVIRIDVRGEKMRAETLYLEEGKALSGSSVAAMEGDTLLLGSVFEPHFLRCKLPSTE